VAAPGPPGAGRRYPLQDPVCLGPQGFEPLLELAKLGRQVLPVRFAFLLDRGERLPGRPATLANLLQPGEQLR